MCPLYPWFALSFLVLAGCGGAVTQAEEPEPKPGGINGRAGSNREKLVKEGGGNVRSEAAVAAGLKWIAAHQAADGHWGLHDFSMHGKCNCGGAAAKEQDVTGAGLALLAFLGAGETHKGTSIYAKHVEKGLKWLIARQDAAGSLSKDGYEHALGTIAICEAYGLTADPVLKGPAQQAVDRCVACQERDGGFRVNRAKDDELVIDGRFMQP